MLARVVDFGIDVRRPTTGATAIPFINAGFANGTYLSNMIEVREAVAGSLLGGRTITLTLPAGAQFNTAAAPSVTPGTIVAAAPLLSDAGRTATFIATAYTAARTVLFSFPANSILVSPTAAAGDLAVTVAGTAGAAGTVKIATIRPVATVSAAAAPTLGIGTVGQAAGDIVISEAAAGRIWTGDVVLTLPTGVVFSAIYALPTVTRPTGNIALGTATLTGRNVLTIPVTSVSTVASAIYLSGIRYDVTRTAMDGPVNVTVDGSAIVSTATTANVSAAFAAAVAANRPRVANATVGVVAPPVIAPPVIAPPVTVFTIGALSFVRAGVTTPIDVAPSIVAGRTMLPLRFAALAVGVSADDIIWDATRRTVTLLRGDRVVQLRIGDRIMTINGSVVPLEVPAAIQGGRIVLPIGAIARALRARTVWDPIARTVTVTE
ncbi:MAG: hypothetical protein DDT20_01683 [Firmicutes bacterium]|nr:hypothetical protein [Bacillota bacterium]